MNRLSRTTLAAVTCCLLLTAGMALAQPAFAQETGNPTDLAELFKFVFTQKSATAFALFNVFCLVAMRLAILSQRWAFSIAAVFGALVGANTAVIEAQAAVGVNTFILGNAYIVGLGTGAGAATLIGLVIGKGMEAAGYGPSTAKQQAEAFRDPMNPAAPTGGS